MNRTKTMIVMLFGLFGLAMAAGGCMGDAAKLQKQLIAVRKELRIVKATAEKMKADCIAMQAQCVKIVESAGQVEVMGSRIVTAMASVAEWSEQPAVVELAGEVLGDAVEIVTLAGDIATMGADVQEGAAGVQTGAASVSASADKGIKHVDKATQATAGVENRASAIERYLGYGAIIISVGGLVFMAVYFGLGPPIRKLMLKIGVGAGARAQRQALNDTRVAAGELPQEAAIAARRADDKQYKRAMADLDRKNPDLVAKANARRMGQANGTE